MKFANKIGLSIAAVVLWSGGIAYAQGHDGHSAHGTHAEAGPDQAVIHHNASAALEAYRDALLAKDINAAGAVFAKESLIFENGKAEGSWTNYAEHHLGPELGHFVSIDFPAYEVEIEVDGHQAFGLERFKYRIELDDGRIIEREGVATSVLRHGADGWKILRYHSSSRAPQG